MIYLIIGINFRERRLYGDNTVHYIDGLYDQYTLIAFEETIARLQELENIKTSVFITSTKHITTMTLWFLSIEAFISNILNIFSIFTETPVNKNKIYQKIGCILEGLSWPIALMML